MNTNKLKKEEINPIKNQPNLMQHTSAKQVNLDEFSIKIRNAIGKFNESARKIEPIDRTQTHKVIGTTKDIDIASIVRQLNFFEMHRKNKMRRTFAEQRLIAKYEAEKIAFAEEFKHIEQAVSKIFKTMYK